MIRTQTPAVLLLPMLLSLMPAAVHEAAAQDGPGASSSALSEPTEAPSEASEGATDGAGGTAGDAPEQDLPAASSPAAGSGSSEKDTPLQAALRARIDALPAGDSDADKSERAAIADFYAARNMAPLWIESTGLSAKAEQAAGEFKRAAEWGLDPADFSLPAVEGARTGGAELSPREAAGADLEFTLAVLKYARHARGGRIISPAELLNSNLDRKPQLIKPREVLDGAAAASDGAAYLRSLHPQHAQFQRLREKYLAAGGGAGKGAWERTEVRRLLANMEMWRWMWPDLGEAHVFANVPEFMMRYVENGSVVHTERIVVGETGKQTSIFSRPMKNIVLRPMWRVPESIKVRELWPSLKRGGGLMRQYGLELETKDGRPLDWRTMDWAEEDMRNYEVVQPPGPKSAMGVVKFSFPSQHTIFMHDTPDKWMFNARQRTLSHGCLRLRNPVRLAELILADQKGWDAGKVAQLIKSGPNNNEIVLDGKVRMHLAYFTLWVDDDGKLKSFADIYGHEKRVSLALEGKWDQIDKGRDHLAPVEPVAVSASPHPSRAKPSQTALDDFMSSMRGGF